MTLLFRILFAVAGLLALALAIGLWLQPAHMATMLGIAAQSSVGTATIRADIAGFFLGTGTLALLAAWRSNSRYALSSLILLVAAFAGRVVNVALAGYSPALLPSMIVEIVLITVFTAGYRRMVD
jgi:hypothetical protein